MSKEYDKIKNKSLVVSLSWLQSSTVLFAFITLHVIKVNFTNSVDPDQMHQKLASDQGLRCLN